MPKKTYNELTAGIFVLATTAVLLGLIIWLGGSNLFHPAQQRVVFVGEEKDGAYSLQKGSFVLIGDDQVGKITSVHFDPDKGQTFYTAEIERKDVKLHADGKVRVAAALIGAPKMVITNRGTAAAPLADEAHPVALAGGLDKAMGNLEDATAKVSQIAEAIAKEFNAQDSSALLNKIHGVVDSLKSASTDVAAIASSVKIETDLKNDASLLTKFHGSMDDVNQMTSDAAPKVGEATSQILKITSDVSDVSGQVREVMMLNRDNIDEILDNMTQVSANLKATAREVRRNPWRLLYRPDKKEVDSQNLYDAARNFVSGAEQLDQAMSKLDSLMKGSATGLAADDPELLKMREQLQKSFTNFSKAEQELWKELGK